jgi:hypothetical protein
MTQVFRPVIQETSRPGEALVLPEMTEALLAKLVKPGLKAGTMGLRRTQDLNVVFLRLCRATGNPR